MFNELRANKRELFLTSLSRRSLARRRMPLLSDVRHLTSASLSFRPVRGNSRNLCKTFHRRSGGAALHSVLTEANEANGGLELYAETV
jgi:hypothetical protein